MLGHPWWLVALAVVGVISLVGVTLGLFSNLGEEPGRGTITKVVPAGSSEFLDALGGATNAPVREGGGARLHDNGDAFFPAIFAALGAAERSINLMMYIWEPGAVSTRLFDVLVDRARAGVQVRVMIDGLGGHKAPKERIRELEAAGGRWCWFHPPRFGQLSYFHKRNHRRAIVVDGKIGFLGGGAVADKWLGNAGDPEHWRDAMVELRGPLATSLQPAFVQLWSHVTAEMLSGPDFFPAHEAAAPGEEISRHVSVLSSPDTDDYPLRRVFWLSFRCAERSIHITNPYFVPDRMAREVLKERARAGVDVRVLVPNEHNDVFLIRWASHSYYEEMLAAGVRIYEYQPTMIHHKHLVVDDRWVVVGSANMDVRSKELNQESVIGLVDAGFARTVRDSFLADLEHAREIRLAGWRARPAWRRVPERFFRVFEEQF